MISWNILDTKGFLKRVSLSFFIFFRAMEFKASSQIYSLLGSVWYERKKKLMDKKIRGDRK